MSFNLFFKINYKNKQVIWDKKYKSISFIALYTYLHYKVIQNWFYEEFLNKTCITLQKYKKKIKKTEYDTSDNNDDRRILIFYFIVGIFRYPYLFIFEIIFFSWF